MKRIFIPLMLLLPVLSCQKETTNQESEKCELTAASFPGSYKITANSYRKDGTSPFVDVYANYDACEKDDIILINSNKTIIFNDAGTKCTPSGDSTGNWALTSNTVTINGKVYAVTAFDCTSMSGTLAGSAAGELITVTLTRL